MATPKDTLTAYTQALNTIATQTFDPSRLLEFTYSADSTLTLTLTGGLAPGIINGHIYGITVNGLSEPIYATFLEVHAKSSGDSLKFKRLSPDAEKIIKAVLAQRDTHEAKSAGKSYTLADLHAMQDRINGLAAFAPFTFTWDRSSPFPTWTHGDSPQWREGEGNNP